MTITRNSPIEEWRNGVLISSTPRVIDVTAEETDKDLRTKARQALNANKTFLDLASPTNAQTLAQVQRLTRETSALIRLFVAGDLLVESTDT